MPKIALTDLTVKSLKAPEKGQVTYFDKALPGFGLRISKGGTKTFTLVYGANRQRRTIGKYGVISLAAARREAKDILAEHTLGKSHPKSISYEEAVRRYLEDCAQKNKPRTVREYTWLLNRHLRFGRVKLDDISKHDLTRRIAKLKDIPSEQNYTFAVARAFFRWAVRYNYLEHSPMEGLQKPARTPSRNRVLSDAELSAVFNRALKTRYPFGPLVAVLILTGQRRGEIAALRWEWIDQANRTITLPDTITKNRRLHSFPYGAKAAQVLAGIPETSELLFPAQRRRTPENAEAIFNGWSSAKKTFDKGLENVAPYTLHDLRRTFSSKLAALGTPIHVTEKLLNHTSGTLSGVAAIYNRYNYMDEMRASIEKFEKHLEKVAMSGS